MMQVFDKRPPFVRFEEREMGRNEAASQAAGRPVPNVVILACITPFASKDVVEKPATEWLEQIRQQAVKGDYPPEWAQRFKLQYDEYIKGNELPREGTPIKTWQMLSHDQKNRCRAVDISVVEDLAVVPDSGLHNMGLDGRYMRDLAKAWIAEGKDKGIVAQELAAANAKIADQAVLIQRMNDRLAELEARANAARLEDAPRRGPGRPRKEEPAELQA
jgi:hypothetical protein